MRRPRQNKVVMMGVFLIGLASAADFGHGLNDGLPGGRLPTLRRLLEESDRPLRILETHSGLSGLIAEHARGTPSSNRDGRGGEPLEFDGMWSSSLTASACKGKPDIETVDTTSRLGLVQETLSVTTKPMIYDADTGGQPEIFKFTVRALEQLGVSACIIEDKTGLKQNSLFGSARKQQLEEVDAFCAKIQAGLHARRSADFMVIARVEALIAGAGMEEALTRAEAYTRAGASGIMIHSKEETPDEILEFIGKYKARLGETAAPLVVVPSSYNSIYESELCEAGVAICIYANHMLRASYPAMLTVAESILTHQRSKEADELLMPVKRIITLIDEDASSAPKQHATVSASQRPPHDAEQGVDEAAAVAALHAWRGGQSVAPVVAEAPPPSTKVDPKRLLENAKDELGISCFVGVPDSCLAPFCAEVANDVDPRVCHAITANEGGAVMMAVGHHLATGEVPLVYMQNSGLGNAINPLMSAAHPEVYAVPMVLLVGWRGAPGTKDEPQHVVQGRQTQAMLEAMGVPCLVLPTDDASAAATMERAVSLAKERLQPVAVLVPPKTFAGAKHVAPMPNADEMRPTREQALSAIVEAVGANDVVVSTTGYTSRELFELRKIRGQPHHTDFLTVGSMGHSIAIAQGIARAQPQRTVWCLDGDGAALMHLGSLASSQGLPNLRHVVLNNRVHDSVGGQPTAASQQGSDGSGAGATAFDYTAIAAAAGYETYGAVATAEGLAAALTRMGSSDYTAAFLEVQLALGTREDLGRPTISTHECKDAFMTFLRHRGGFGAADAAAGGGTGSSSETAHAATSQDAAPSTIYRTETGDPLLLTPGPLTTSASVKQAMLHDYGSRDPHFITLTARVREQILDVLDGETKHAVHDAFTCVPLQGSGTFAVEAMLMQFLPCGDDTSSLLVLSNGAYGRRMAKICEQHRRRCTLVELPEDAPVDPVSLASVLAQHPDASHVAVVHCETTTGVVNDVRRIATVVQAAGRRLLIDAMSAFGVLPLDSRMPFDAVAASSNKGLQGSPGLAFVIARKSALEEARYNADSLVLDLYAQWKGFEKNGQWRFTPPTHCVLALSRALDELTAEGGVRGRFARYTANCATLVNGMRALGFRTLLPDAVQAPVIVTFHMPADPAFVFDDFYARLAASGFIIYPGKLTERPSFRVGCIGHVEPRDLQQFLGAVSEVVEEMGVRDLGRSLA